MTLRTCSYTATLIAVSWRVSYDATTDVLTEVEIVADRLLSRSHVAALLTVRLRGSAARAEVFVDDHFLASYDFSTSLPEPDGIPGSLFRRVVPLPAEFVDGETHVLTVRVEQAELEPPPIATLQSAFYARSATNRLTLAPAATEPDTVAPPLPN